MKVMYRILPVLLFINGWLYGQEYNRSSVSLILMDYKDGLQEQVYRAFSALQPGDRYDRNKIATDLLVYNGSREYKAKDILSGKMKIASPDRTELLTDYLNDQNVGLQVIGVIFNRQADGIMNMEIVNQRAAYNKTDAEYDVLQATAKSTAGLREGGEALIRNSYIMVYDYANLRYEYVESKYESQEDFFWKATPAVYLFRVDFTDELRQKFYDECWMDEETEEADRAAIRERFATFRIPVKFVMKYNTTREVATGIHDFRKKSKNEKGNVTEEDLKAAALTKLITGAFDYLNEQIERKNEIFQVKTVVDEVKPVRARIGLKEGVKTDQRYFMYETRQDRAFTVKWALRDNLGNIQREETISLTVPALTSVWMDKVDLPKINELEDYVSFDLYEQGRYVSGGTVIFTLPKYYHYADPELSCRVEGDQIVVSAKAYAKGVEIQNENQDLLLSDNYFDMNAGETRVKLLSGKPEGLRLRSVYDIR